MLFGVACFPLYAPAGLIRDQPAFAAWSRRRLIGAAVVALASGVAWLALTAAGMSGQASDALSPSAIGSVITDTDFGKLWLLRLAGCVLLVIAPLSRRLAWTPAPLAGAVLASLAGTGHADLPQGTALGLAHTVGDGVHLLAAGLWLGALWALGWMVVRLPEAPQTALALRRFSGLGQLAVALLIATGLVNAWAILDGIGALWRTGYGRLLTLKLLAFAGMLALAGLNRFVLTPRVGRSASAMPQLRLHILGEQALSFAVLGVVAVIGASDPAT